MFGVTSRNTFHKQYRAAAYAFPLDEFNRGGRPVKRDDDIDVSDIGGDGDIDETADQRAAHEIVDDTDESEAPGDNPERVETWGETAEGSGTPMNELLHDDEPP